MDDTSNALVLSSLTSLAVDNVYGVSHLLLGVSSTDKSIRIHDLDSGTGLIRDYGHSEGLVSLITLRSSIVDNII